MRDGQEIQISMPMKDNATPIAQKPRRVPYLLTAPLQKWVEEFEQIKHHWTSPSTWGDHVVFPLSSTA